MMAGVDQFNLIGDQRLVDKQVIQLGALENETRGGIARIKFRHAGRPRSATGFTLSATQILDSTFLTFGVVLGAQRDRLASAHGRLRGGGRRRARRSRRRRSGFESGDTSIFDNIFNKIAWQVRAQRGSAAGANGKAADPARRRVRVLLHGPQRAHVDHEHGRPELQRRHGAHVRDHRGARAQGREHRRGAAGQEGHGRNATPDNTSADNTRQPRDRDRRHNNTSRAIIG